MCGLGEGSRRGEGWPWRVTWWVLTVSVTSTWVLPHPLECVQYQARCLNHCHTLSSLTHRQPYNSTLVQTPPSAWNFLQHILSTPCQGPRVNQGSVIKFHLWEVKEVPWADIPTLSPTLRFSRLLCFCGFQKSSSGSQKLSLCFSTVTILLLPKADGDGWRGKCHMQENEEEKGRKSSFNTSPLLYDRNAHTERPQSNGLQDFMHILIQRY